MRKNVEKERVQRKKPTVERRGENKPVRKPVELIQEVELEELEVEQVLPVAVEEPEAETESKWTPIEPDEPGSDDAEAVDAISVYMKEIAHIPLLTAQQEVELAKAMESGKKAEARLRRAVSPNERARLEETIRAGDRARKELIRANSRLVVAIAKRYLGRGLSFSDLIQEGNLGLIHAADKFDYKRGFKFSTYATWWIRQSVTRAIAGHGRTIRLPVHMWDKVNRLGRVSQQLAQVLERKPTREEIAEQLGTTATRVERLMQISQQPLSLETPVGEDGDAELGDFVPSDAQFEPASNAQRELLREEIQAALDSLPPREARILKMRFGLENGHAFTLEEIGRKFGYTRERIRQLEAQALRRLRHPSRSRSLKEYRYE